MNPKNTVKALIITLIAATCFAAAAVPISVPDTSTPVTDPAQATLPTTGRYNFTTLTLTPDGQNKRTYLIRTDTVTGKTAVADLMTTPQQLQWFEIKEPNAK